MKQNPQLNLAYSRRQGGEEIDGLGRGSPCGLGGGQRRGVGQAPRSSELIRSSMDSRGKYRRRRSRREGRPLLESP